MRDQHLKANADDDCDQNRATTEQANACVNRGVQETNVQQVENLVQDQRRRLGIIEWATAIGNEEETGHRTSSNGSPFPRDFLSQQV
ncbi:MAG: hypothetical protein WD341_07035 [Tistlia sp.]